LSIIKQIGEEEEYPRVLNNIAVIHASLGNYDQAKAYYKECIALNKTYGSKKSLSSNYNNLAVVLRESKDPQGALEFYKKSANLRTEIGDSIGLATNYSNMGSCYEDMDSLDIALEYYQQSLKIRSRKAVLAGIPNAQRKIASAYVKKQMYEQALPIALEAYSRSLEGGFKQIEKSSAEVLYMLYKGMNDDKKTLYYLEKYSALNDSLNGIENQRKVIESGFHIEYIKKHIIDSLNNEKILIKSELADKDKKLAKRSLRVQRLWTALSVLVTLLLIAILIIYRRNVRNREYKLRTEVRLRLNEIINLKGRISEHEEREEDILDLMILGLSNKEIGEKLFLSVNTIKTHVNSLYLKLDVNNRTQAAVKASLIKAQEQQKHPLG